ncbi:MAG: addiction module protein [Hyphomicrobium sp.]
MKQLEREALQLSELERCEFVDGILASVHRHVASVYDAWVEEAKDRLSAWRRGELGSRPAAEVFAKHIRP